MNPSLSGIRLHPIKALDPVLVNEARIGKAGGLEHDRVWALYSADGEWVNGRHTAAVHPIRAAFANGLKSATLSPPNGARKISTKTFSFPDDTAGAAQWFSQYFDQPITVRYSPEGFPDDTVASGPTIISTATLETICGLFPGMKIEEARLRFRMTLEIGGVPAFWEDQLFGAEERSTVRFRIGEVNFEGSNPCVRCPVPPRDPHTGEMIPGFQKKISDYRRANMPAWVAEARFDHYYRLGVNTRVASTESGKLLRLNDPVVIS